MCGQMGLSRGRAFSQPASKRSKGTEEAAGSRARPVGRPSIIQHTRCPQHLPLASCWPAHLASSCDVDALRVNTQVVQQLAPPGRLRIKDVGHGLHQHAAAAHLQAMFRQIEGSGEALG